MYATAFSGAEKYLHMTSPYLILNYNMINEMVVAAKSGVDIRLILPGIADKKTGNMLSRSFYKPLLKAGVRIFEYTPGFVHSKQCVSDDTKAIIGTINLDYRSLTHHIENAVWIVGENNQTIMDIKEDFLETQSQCHEVTLSEKHYSRFTELVLLPILRIFAPLF